jgi:hypothetical protein
MRANPEVISRDSNRAITSGSLTTLLEQNLLLARTPFVDSFLVASIRELVQSFCCRPDGKPRRLDLVITYPIDSEVFDHIATAAALENLPRIAP